MSKGQLSEVVGKRSRRLFLKGPESLFGVSRVQLRSKTFLIKISNVAHHLTVFFGGKSIFEDLFYLFHHLGGLMGPLGVLKGPRRTKKNLDQTTKYGT